jgi:hypothetical protein
MDERGLRERIESSYSDEPTRAGSPCVSRPLAGRADVTIGTIAARRTASISQA